MAATACRLAAMRDCRSAISASCLANSAASPTSELIASTEPGLLCEGRSNDNLPNSSSALRTARPTTPDTGGLDDDVDEVPDQAPGVGHRRQDPDSSSY